MKVKEREDSAESANLSINNDRQSHIPMSICIPGALSTIGVASRRSTSKRNLPCIISPASHRILDLEEHKLLKSLAKPYE